MRRRLPTRAHPKKTRQEIRDEVLRPSSALGYAEDRIGRHLLVECAAPGPAELFFRRAMWLNPFEPHFQLNVAQSLHAQERFAEATEMLRIVSTTWPDFGPARTWLDRCLRALGAPSEASSP